jgi:multiple sugar transport system ATP-binding protein
MVYVTHDQSEAMTLGHRVAVLCDGRLQQCDAPRALYDRPVNTFVAGFIGSPAMNLLPAVLGANGSIELAGARVALSAQPAGEPGRKVIVGLRPESFELGADGVPARVEVVEELGADAYVFCTADVSGQEMRLVARVDARRPPVRDERIILCPVAGEAHLFDAETGERLS